MSELPLLSYVPIIISPHTCACLKLSVRVLLIFFVGIGVECLDV